MAFLIPPSAKQAILRFAISKIGIIDDTAIDLDKFSFAWGKKSVITLPRVPLKAEKLTSYLPLPPNFQVSEAYINNLRVTIPANLQGIAIDATGIVAKGKVAPDFEQKIGHDGNPTDKSDQEAIPTAEDLAKSFIQDESAEERRQLEAAIRSQSQYLQQDPFTESSIFSDDGYDDPELGTGVGFETPYYVSKYLKLVQDTSKVYIGDIELHIETEVPPEDWDDDEAIQASLVLHIDGVEVDGLTTGTQEEVESSEEDQTKHGKRRITLKSLSAGLLLDEKNMAKSRIASSLAASPTRSRSAPSDSFHPYSAPSPVATRSPLVKSRSPSIDAESSPSPQSSRQFSAMRESVMTTDADRFADAEDENEAPEVRNMATSSDSQRFGQQSLYGEESILQYGMDNGMFDSNVEDDRSATPSRANVGELEHSTRSEYSTESERSPEPGHPQHAVFSGSNSLPGRLPHQPRHVELDYDLQHISRSQPMPQHAPLQSDTAVRDNSVSAAESLSPETTSTSDRSSSASPSPVSSVQGDLAESKLFSHEDAESMYMSAIDDGATQSSRPFHMPGAWDTSSVSSNESDRIYHPPAPITAASLDPIVEKDDGCETPRPGSRVGAEAASGEERSFHESEADLPTRVFLPLVDVDVVSVWVPFEKASQEMPDADPLAYPDEQPRSRVAFAEDSVFQDVPGSFSQYAASTARSRPSSSIMRESRRLPTQQRPTSARSSESSRADPKKQPDDEIEVSVGNVRLQVDVETIYLAMRLVKMVQQLFGEPPSMDNKKESRKEAKKTKDDASSNSAAWSFKFAMETLHVALLKELSTQGVASNKLVGGLRHAEWDLSEVLLTLHTRDVSAAAAERNGSLKANLKVGIFFFGFGDQGILNFQPDTGLDETTMDVNKPIECDISIAYTEDNGGPRIDVSTLPINISLDVQKLDDTFASYGGFSGVLKISNHIKSTCVLPPPTPKIVSPPKVHAPEQVPVPKIDARFAGLNFNLKGETCGVILETSTIRTNVRKGGVRMSVKHAKVSGPHSVLSAVLSSNPPLSVEVHDIRMNYAFVPEEADLSDLLSLITPTAFKYEADDDILIDTLLSQRRKGSLIKVRIQGSLQLNVSDLEGLRQLEALGKDVAKLSSVAKLLPDDERPGILSMIEVADCKVAVTIGDRIGKVSLACKEARVAHIGLPALLALSIHAIEASRNNDEWFLDEVTGDRDVAIPMVMARWLGGEMEPTLKVKLYNLLFDYRVTTVMALLGLSEDCTADDVAFEMASSMATIKRAPSPGITRQSSAASEKPGPSSHPMHLDLLLRDCAIGLNPHKSQAKALVVLSDTRFTGSLIQDITTASLDIRRASLLVVDDVGRVDPDRPQSSTPSQTGLGTAQVNDLCRWGFVTVGTVSKAKAVVKISESHGDGPRSVDVEFKNDLFVMESCADSTQTLIAIFGGLAPPQPPSKEVQYRTKVEPVLNMMASLVGEEFKGARKEDQLHMDQSVFIDDDDQDIHFEGSIYDPSNLPNLDEMTEESIEQSMLESQQRIGGEEPLEELNFKEDFFAQPSGDQPAAQAWDSRKNEYIESSEVSVTKSPLTLRVKNIHFIWNLYDGYDWPRTRDKLSQKLEEVEQRAQERRERGVEDEDEGVSFEEDLLFGSVYITLPVNNTPEENRRQITQALRGGDDTASETSFATTTASKATTRPHRRRLKLERGRHHKIKFELSGISADVVVFPPGHGETQNSIDVRVENLDIIDHVPTSTWNKFITYDKGAGERPLGSPMIRLEMLTVRPVPTLAASELVLRVSVLPLRLHVDQDALDFITRFFEFKDDRLTSKDAPGEQPFIQRLEVRTVKLKLDYKPKKVDYAGLRSGHTTEFMNFLILDSADITLRRCIVYGISGFDKVHKTLNDIWMPDVKSNQIPKIVTGLAFAAPVANVGKAIAGVVTVPISEYKKDGRIFRSVQKGAVEFARNTSTELFRLGGKVSIGTQAIIQTAEGILSPVSPSAGPSHAQQDDATWHDLPSPGSPSAVEPRVHSNYADQPIGVRAGLISARRHLQQDFNSARDAIIAIPGEVMESGTATGAAKAVVRHAPVVILRPFTGVAKAAGATMFGAANALDPESKRKIDDKYKRH